MTIGGPSGVGNGPTAVTRAITALARLAEVGSVDGRVSALLSNGGMRVTTPIGLLLVADAGPYKPGESLRLRYDPQTGQAVPEAASNAARGSGAGAPTGTAAALLADAAEPDLPALSPLLQGNSTAPGVQAAILAGLQPVVAGLAPPPEAALAAMFPQAGSVLFSLIATLFPQSLQEGHLRRQTRRQRPPRPRVKSRAERAADMALPEEGEDDTAPLEDAVLESWTLPVFTGEELQETRWSLHLPVPEPEAETAEPEAKTAEAAEEAPAGAPPPETARLELTLARIGRLRLDARRAGDCIHFDIASESPLPEALARRIRDQAQKLSEAWGAGLSCSFRHGADLFTEAGAAPQP